MDSITLKTEPNKVVMYGFIDHEEWTLTCMKKIWQIKWFSNKDRLLEKDEDFWKELVWSNPMVSDCYKDYQRKYSFCRFTVTSGHSAIDSLSENLYILIVETKE
jgi:hypothetical protein